MTEQQYLEYRKQEEVPMELFYEYYKNMRIGTPTTLEDFRVTFPQFLLQLNGHNIATPKGIKSIEFGSIINKVYSYFNEKFNL